MLRKYLPQLQYLKRIHLNDVGLDSEQGIALAEVLPEIPYLAHIGLLENPKLTGLASAHEEELQEEACAFYASMMAAVRVSKSIVSIDIDMPTADASELVKAIGKQILAYALRNMERGPTAEPIGDPPQEDSITEVPDILLHLVGHVDGYAQNHDLDEPAPNEDYIVSGTGVVKALGICLGNKASDGRRSSRPISRGFQSDSDSGANTPSQRRQDAAQFRAKDMSKNLLDSARKIRARLQLALAKEAKTPDDLTYSKCKAPTTTAFLTDPCPAERLQFLDATLTRMIERFEEEYPETKQPSPPQGEEQSSESGSLASSAQFSNPFARTEGNAEGSAEVPNVHEEQEPEDASPRRRLSRHGSDVSLASRHLDKEEGQMHRLGQQVRRSILGPSTFDYHHQNDVLAEAEHLKLLRAKLESLSGSEIQEEVKALGVDQMMLKLGSQATDLLALEKQDPEGFQQLIEAHRNATASVHRNANSNVQSVQATEGQETRRQR